ncbi:hypothetical protein DLAC_10219 [Tieghemostelium lacteum]|uniref:Uncharacterized protein n=1 Tax=Tieghemostelium lacteum TaxID=361077 RepID=A0A151Z4V6_TIELA|nr:hypothetical protein DLAC_10219 [Tieghemostelium lacteum]|eukprot:KYQ89003.1 hypothetical protein DLAC_10219 [Tieghemostelium lacteum]
MFGFKFILQDESLQILIEEYRNQMLDNHKISNLEKINYNTFQNSITKDIKLLETLNTSTEVNINLIKPYPSWVAIGDVNPTRVYTYELPPLKTLLQNQPINRNIIQLSLTNSKKYLDFRTMDIEYLKSLLSLLVGLVKFDLDTKFIETPTNSIDCVIEVFSCNSYPNLKELSLLSMRSTVVSISVNKFVNLLNNNKNLEILVIRGMQLIESGIGVLVENQTLKQLDLDIRGRSVNILSYWSDAVESQLCSLSLSAHELVVPVSCIEFIFKNLRKLVIEFIPRETVYLSAIGDIIGQNKLPSLTKFSLIPFGEMWMLERMLPKYLTKGLSASFKSNKSLTKLSIVCTSAELTDLLIFNHPTITNITVLKLETNPTSQLIESIQHNKTVSRLVITSKLSFISFGYILDILNINRTLTTFSLISTNNDPSNENLIQLEEILKTNHVISTIIFELPVHKLSNLLDNYQCNH